MDEAVVIRSLGDITTELTNIGDGIKDIPAVINTLMESESGRKYFDDSLGMIIKEATVEVLTKLSVSDAGKNYYYGEVVDLVKNALSEVITKLGSPKIDMSPVMKIAADISKQNSDVISAILSINNEDGKSHEELFSMIVKMVESINEFISVSVSQKEYLQKMEELIAAVNRKPDSWVFKHTFNSGRIESSTATAKYKA